MKAQDKDMIRQMMTEGTEMLIVFIERMEAIQATKAKADRKERKAALKKSRKARARKEAKYMEGKPYSPMLQCRICGEVYDGGADRLHQGQEVIDAFEAEETVGTSIVDHDSLIKACQVQSDRIAELEDALEAVKTELRRSHNDASRNLEAAHDSAVNYGIDKGYWMAMREVMVAMNMWEAIGLGITEVDDNTPAAFQRKDADDMIRDMLSGFFLNAEAGWGEKFPEYARWSE